MVKLSPLQDAIAAFGADAKNKLSNPAARGAPEDQLRAPLEKLIKDLAALTGIARDEMAVVGEASLRDLKTRPDYAITLDNVLVGFVEIKAPGKGADPSRYKDRHDKAQWEKLKSLPNLIYTDGNSFSLWRDGELVGAIVHLDGDIETAGANLRAPDGIEALFEAFFKWSPIAPRDARQLAGLSARLCRLLRDDVREQLGLGNQDLKGLATDWRKLLFPEASDEQFADGYAQAVTFGLLMARARKIALDNDLALVAKQLGKTNSLIGTALRILTDNDETRSDLKTSLDTLIRVLNVVDWAVISKGEPDTWLYFYEEFLEVYDNELRKKTGSYYTPPQVVTTMVRLVDEVLQSRFDLPAGFAAPEVTVVDPAVGTGTFPLGILRRIATNVESDQGAGAVPAAIRSAMERLIAFEMQLGPFAVAQLRIEAEFAELTGAAPSKTALRMFVTDTLSDPHGEQGYLPQIFGPIAESRRQANTIKKDERVMVVIGNPPYKEKAKGLGGWIETKIENAVEPEPLAAWFPPAEWGVSAHAKHLRNLYVYFWRWATWKVFDTTKHPNTGVVCFITVAGFLNGPGFQKMRDYLRRTTDEIWVIDCSPEGHQPEVNTRIFQGVQQPVCIVIASRSPARGTAEGPARVLYRSLSKGLREQKFATLNEIVLEGDGWMDCPSDWRAPFLPAIHGLWSAFVPLEQLFVYNGSGVMPGRTWVIAPDQGSLEQRWQTLIDCADEEEKEQLFHPHQGGDRNIARIVSRGLPGYEPRPTPVAKEQSKCVKPIRYGFRSFDRQWIIPDNRVINRPNPEWWHAHSARQVYLSALVRHAPKSGPAVTFTGLIPDHDHYKGSFAGRAYPLWMNKKATISNIRPGVLVGLAKRYEMVITAEDVMAYLAAVASHPAYTARFREDLVQPGLRIPITADVHAFTEAVSIGRTVLWLHTFGERFADAKAGRPARAPRLPSHAAPKIPAGGAIPNEPEAMPDSIDYDSEKRRLVIGTGYIDNVSPEVWAYEISGKQVLRQWFSYRKRTRERPIIGDRRQPSSLGDIQPDHWPAEYTTELLDVLHVLGRLVELEPLQADLLERICTGPLLTADELHKEGAFTIPADFPTSPSAIAEAQETTQTSLFESFPPTPSSATQASPTSSKTRSIRAK